MRRVFRSPAIQDIINREAKPGRPECGPKNVRRFTVLAKSLKCVFFRIGRVALLSDFVENFWLCDGYASPHLRERIFPSGTFGLVLSIFANGDLRIYTARHPDRCTHLPGAVVSGPYRGYFITDRTAEASVMAVSFKPGGAFPFLDLRLTSYWIRTLVFRTFGGELRLRFANGCPLRHTCAPVSILQDALLSHLVPRPEHHPAVLSALDYFRRQSLAPYRRKRCERDRT